uniref:Bifunctional nuclease 1 n=1 Tax=Rhizophora mucronata TaxID=61149 RepID=A0A2P2MB06_RHIMU
MCRIKVVVWHGLAYNLFIFIEVFVVGDKSRDTDRHKRIQTLLTHHVLKNYDTGTTKIRLHGHERIQTS